LPFPELPKPGPPAVAAALPGHEPPARPHYSRADSHSLQR